MKSTTKTILATVGVFAIAGLLFSFSGNTDDEKMKRYQVIHQMNGEVVEYDTVVPMTSSYSVEDFLADKGIENENVEIIQLSSFNEELDFVHDELEGAQLIIKEVMNDMKMEIHEDGENVFFEMIIDEEHEGEEVKITCTIDDEGNMITKKVVNGEEVELTQEEIDQLKSHSSEDGHMIIRIEDGENNMEEIMQEFELNTEELKELENLNMDELEHQIQIITEEIETIDGENGEMKIIIRHSENGEERTKERIIHLEGDEEVEWQGENGAHMRVMQADEGEDFTIVLVTENYDSSMETNADVHIRKEISVNEIAVYPNPSSGIVNIRINQSEEIKTSIEITNTQGKSVFKEKLGKFSGEYTKEINLKAHGAGTYMITIQQGDNVNTEKVIIK